MLPRLRPRLPPLLPHEAALTLARAVLCDYPTTVLFYVA
jgi:hypothetical protein